MRLLGALAAGMCNAGLALAEPCVSATFDTPLAGATGVVTRQVDVPSPQFPGLWQEGQLNGFFYALYANGEAVVSGQTDTPVWAIVVNCNVSTEDCALATDGAPPEGAQAVATVLAHCLRGTSVTDPVEAEIKPDPAPAPKPPCGLAQVPAGRPVATLQNLLAAAGVDPGPLDGLMGGKTRAATVDALGRGLDQIGIEQAIADLDALLCAQGD